MFDRVGQKMTAGLCLILFSISCKWYMSRILHTVCTHTHTHNFDFKKVLRNSYYILHLKKYIIDIALVIDILTQTHFFRSSVLTIKPTYKSQNFRLHVYTDETKTTVRTKLSFYESKMQTRFK